MMENIVANYNYRVIFCFTTTIQLLATKFKSDKVILTLNYVSAIKKLI